MKLCAGVLFGVESTRDDGSDRNSREGLGVFGVLYTVRVGSLFTRCGLREKERDR